MSRSASQKPTTSNHAGSLPANDLSALDPSRWEVDVRVCGERVLTIGSHGHLSGYENIHLYSDAVRAAAEHLQSFIGPDRSGLLSVGDHWEQEQIAEISRQCGDA